ncbi:alpha/beta hydrolase [soil metagenome]
MNRTVALLLLLLAGCSRPGSLEPNLAAEEGYFTGADSARLFYRAIGRGRDTVVVVHGFQGNNQNYLAPDLLPLARGRTLLFYDQRGAGRSSPVSDPAQLGIEAHVRDVEALRQHFRLERLSLLGHSGGAAIVARYAVAHPGRTARLVLVTPPPPVREPFSEQTMRAFFPRVDSATWVRVNALQASLPTAQDPVSVCQDITRAVLPHAYFANPANAERMRGDFCASPPEKLRTQAQRTAAFQQSLPADWRPSLRPLRVPVLVIHGAHDAIPLAASRAWVQALPDARLLVLPSADHLPWVEQPEQFISAVDQFFRGNWPVGAEIVR